MNGHYRIFALFVLLISVLGGCRVEEVDKPRLAREIDAVSGNTSEENGVYYIGSNKSHHYFIVRETGESERFLKAEHLYFYLPVTFQYTTDEDNWRLLIPESFYNPGEKGMFGYEFVYAFSAQGKNYYIEAPIEGH